MIPAVRLGLRLALGSARDQRLRAASVLVAVFVGAVVLLSTAAIAHSQQVQQPEVYANVDNQRLLAAVVASILFPVLVLAATVGRLSAGLRDRRMANLRLLGMGRASVRLVAAAETGVAAFAGALLGILGFLVVRQPLAQVRVAGHGWPSYTLWPPAWSYVAVVLLLTAVVMAVGAIPQRLKMADALARARRADSRRPGWWRVVPLALGILGCLYVIRADLSKGVGTSVVVALFVGVALLGIGLILLVPVFVRLLADLTLRSTRRPTLTIAARRLQAQPAGVSRVISGLLIGLFLVVGARSVVVAFESTGQYQRADHQLHQAQLASGILPARTLTGELQRITGIPQVRHVVALPLLGSRCDYKLDYDSRGCLNAVVATCAQLHRLDPGIQGCVPGKPLVIYNTWGLGISPSRLLPFHPVRNGRILQGSAGIRVPAEATKIAGHTEADFELLDLLGASIVLPPSLPGLAAQLSRADRSIAVIAAPGRGLADSLTAAGVTRIHSDDFSYYDFVVQLRALVWSIAAIILSIGLLAFAVAAVDRAVNRRREVTALQLVGIPRAVLRRTQWIEASAPLALGCCLAIGLGLLAGATYLNMSSDWSRQPLPWMQALALAGLAGLGSVLVGALTVIASSPQISPDLIRQE